MRVSHARWLGTAGLIVEALVPAPAIARQNVPLLAQLAASRGDFRRAADRVLRRLSSHPAFDGAARTEIRSYARIFRAQVDVAWKQGKGR